jgi:hypothetical protein
VVEGLIVGKRIAQGLKPGWLAGTYVGAEAPISGAKHTFSQAIKPCPLVFCVRCLHLRVKT